MSKDVKILFVVCLVILVGSLLLNFHYMGQWSGELRNQYEMGVEDGKSQAIVYWEAEIQKARERAINDLIARELQRTQAREEYQTRMAEAPSLGIGWSTGRSNAP